jgi:hypothetical protein
MTKYGKCKTSLFFSHFTIWYLRHKHFFGLGASLSWIKKWEICDVIIRAEICDVIIKRMYNCNKNIS